MSFVSGELLARALEYYQYVKNPHRVQFEQYKRIFSDERGEEYVFGHKPNVRVKLQEGDVSYTLATNAEGLRELRDYENLEKSVIFLGDSIVEGTSVENHEVMDEVFEKHTGVTTLNFGVACSNTIHEFYWLKSKYKCTYNARLINLGFCLNDFGQNTYLRYFNASLGNWQLYKYLSDIKSDEKWKGYTFGEKINKIFKKSKLALLVHSSIQNLLSNNDRQFPAGSNTISAEQKYYTELTSITVVAAFITIGLCWALISARGEKKRIAAAAELWTVGIHEYDAGRHEDALKCFEKLHRMQPTNSDAYVKAAGCYYDLGRYRQALDAYTNATRLEPDRTSLYILIAYTHKALGQMEAAIANHQLAIQAAPNDPSLYRQLGDVYRGLSRHEEALEAYKHVERIMGRSDTVSLSGFLDLGQVYFEMGQYDQAITALTRVAEYRPDSLTVHKYLAMAYEKLGDTPRATKAEEDHARALRQWASAKPTASNWHTAGTAYYILKQHDESLDAFKHALEIDPNHASTYVGLGDVYCDKESYEEATTFYARAIELDPNCATAFEGFHFIYMARKLPRESLRYLEKAVELNPNIKTTPRLAQTYAWLGRQFAIYPKSYGEAIETYTRAIDLDPNCTDAFEGLASVYATCDSPKEALKYLQRALEIDPNMITTGTALYTYDAIGLSLMSRGGHAGALEIFQHSATIDPNRGRTQQLLGQTYTMLNSYEEALAHLRLAVDIDPNNAITHCLLGEVYGRSGLHQDAIQAYQHAMKLDPNNSMPIDFLAQSYLTCEDVALRDIPKALSLAQKACDLTKYQNADDLNVLAMACAASGDFEKAVQYQEKAVRLTTPNNKESFEEHLAAYRAGELWWEKKNSDNEQAEQP